MRFDLFTRFVKEESGATAIEYALLLGVISIGVVSVFATMGDSIMSAFSADDGGINAAFEKVLGTDGGQTVRVRNGVKE